MRIAAALLLLLGLSTATVWRGYAQTTNLVAEIATGTRCASSVREWLSVHDAGPTAIQQLPGSFGARVYNVPTAQVGRWLALEVDGAGEVRAAIVIADETLRFGWDADCHPIAESAPGPFSDSPTRIGFTDAELRSELEAGKIGVIYLWSPHMPFSVEGLGAINAAAARRGLEFVPILDPGADVEFARESLESLLETAPDADKGSVNGRAFGDDALRRLASVELLFRGMTMHAPSIQLYARGELIGPVLPGVRDVDGYLEFFDSFAQALAR